MSWKARDWTRCFVAALAAAVAGAVFGRMSGFFQDIRYEDWLRWGALDFRQCPESYFGLVSFPPLLAICVVLRLTLFKEFLAPRRQRAVVFPMLLGPTLAIGLALAFMLASVSLGYTDCADWAWSPRFHSMPGGTWIDYFAGSGGEQVVFGFSLMAFIQGMTIGAVLGFESPSTPSGNTGGLTAKRVLFAGIGLLAVLSPVAVISVNSYKRGSDRALCILNCRNVQQAMRSYCGMSVHNQGDVVPGFGASTLIGPRLYLESIPVCPAGGRYTWVEGRIPLVGELMIRCSCPEHVPTGVEDW